MGLFGPEKITLMLERYDYKPGDTIKGTITLNLKKPTQARKLEVGLIGTVAVVSRSSGGSRSHGHHSHHHSSTHHEVIYDFKLPLSADKEYQNEHHQFEIKIPMDILQSKAKSQEMQDKLEDRYGMIGSLIGNAMASHGPIKWKVHAQLDVPMKLDISKSQDIVITQ